MRKFEKFTITKKNYFKVINNIARFVKSDSYCERFGFQWKKWTKIHYDSYTKTTLSRDELSYCLGKDIKTLKAKYILEAGSGGGRFTEVLIKSGALVDSFDFSKAVEANYKNNKCKNLRIFQADILDMPLKNNSYDYVICLHVIQHTPDPKKAIEELYSKVKPGGTLIFDQYKFKWFKSLPTPIGGGGVVYRWFWLLLPKSLQTRLAISVVNFFWPIHWKFKNSKIIQFILFRIAPIRFYYPELPLTKKQHYEFSLVDTHDGLIDIYKNYGTKSGIENFLKSLGAINLNVWYGGNGVIARCQKPKNYYN